MSGFDNSRRDTANSYASFPVAPATGVPGKSTLVDPVAMPASNTPGKQTMAEHLPEPTILRTPRDQKDGPLNWASMVRPNPPPNPYFDRQVVPSREACPVPDDTAMEQPTAHHHSEASFEPRQRSLLTQSMRDERQGCWMAFRGMTMDVMATQKSAGASIAAFQKASLPELAALGFVLPKGFQGDLASLANAQQVPHRGGERLDKLFQSDNSVQLTDKEQATVGGSGAEVLGMNRSDTRLEAAVLRVKAAADTVTASSAAIRAAAFAIESGTAELDVNQTTEEIEEMKQHRASLVQTLEFIADGPERISTLLGKMREAGSACAVIFNLLPIIGLKDAEERLKRAKQKMLSAKMKMLYEQMEQAKATSLAAVEELAARRMDLQAAMSERREAYNTVGARVGSPRIAAMLSAIPLVETVLANAQIIVEKTSTPEPAYTDRAGMGFAIAVRHGFEEAMAFPSVIGMLRYAHTYYGELCVDWRTRLQSLHGVKAQLTGDAPAGGE